MKCSRCATDLPTGPGNVYEVRYGEETNIKRSDCPSCGFCIGLNFTGLWIPLDEILTCQNGAGKDGWKKVATKEEKEVHYALSQILYREVESPDEKGLETIYDLPDPEDLMKLLWVDCNAVGFYTMKPKGSLIEATLECYEMNTLDTAYIKRSYRSKGHGSGLLANLVESYPNENIGFSKPISHKMLRVLKRFLTENVGCRNRFWELEGCGGEGNQKLIWYSLNQRCKN